MPSDFSIHNSNKNNYVEIDSTFKFAFFSSLKSLNIKRWIRIWSYVFLSAVVCCWLFPIICRTQCTQPCVMRLNKILNSSYLVIWNCSVGNGNYLINGFTERKKKLIACHNSITIKCRTIFYLWSKLEKILFFRIAWQTHNEDWKCVPHFNVNFQSNTQTFNIRY